MSKFDPYEHLNIVHNPDGSITRLFNIPKAPVTGDDHHHAPPPAQSVVSKEVVLDAAKKTSLRLYRPTKLPSNDNAVARLPIIVYFHSCGWILHGHDVVMVHENCNLFAGEIPAIVVAVNYRLAPESRLPAQYDDAADALTWIRNQADRRLHPDGEQWLSDFGDFSRCFLYGAGSGGNIVFHAAMRALDLDLSPLNVAGVIMNQPMFGGKQRTSSELKLAADEYLPLPVIDLMWELALPPGTDRDHRYSNPVGDGISLERIKSVGRCLVIGFEGDPMVDRQRELVRRMVLKGGCVEAQFEVGFHGVDLIDSRLANAIVSFVKEFIMRC